MDKSNPLRDKSYKFALKIIQTYKELISDKEYVLSKQFLKSGTSVGANIEEAIQAQSKKDFISKLSIALKEAQEIHYWIRLLRDSKLLKTETACMLLADTEELLRLLTSIIKTSKKSLIKHS